MFLTFKWLIRLCFVATLVGVAAPAGAAKGTSELDAVASKCSDGERESLLLSAQKGDAEAMYELGATYLSQDCPVEKRHKAKVWLMSAVETGHTRAAMALGLYYLLEEDDNKRGYVYLRIAAEDGHAEAQHYFGMMMLDPSTPFGNRDEGLIWLGTASSNGSALSALILGLIHDHGLKGVAQDACAAMDWYEASLLLGLPDGHVRLRQLASDLKHDC
ncbi:MAG: tetratricopeptide repeat protein [Pseudomonadota bacterium]